MPAAADPSALAFPPCLLPPSQLAPLGALFGLPPPDPILLLLPIICFLLLTQALESVCWLSLGGQAPCPFPRDPGHGLTPLRLSVPLWKMGFLCCLPHWEDHLVTPLDEPYTLPTAG